MDGAVEGLGGGNGVAAWTAPMSTLMLKYLANLVTTGVKTGKGFKKVYFNACARAINDKFSTKFNGEQIKNHHKTWSRKWAKIINLKKVSAAGFDEVNNIITLDEEHYNDYVKDHKADAEYFNKPIECYTEMEIIYGKDKATGKFAKDSSAALGTEDGDTEEGDLIGTEHDPSSQGEQAGTSNSRPTKRAKIVETVEDGLIDAFNKVGDKIAVAITKVAKANNELPEDLFAQVNSLSVGGFDGIQISMYYMHLVANPNLAIAFSGLPFENKLHWIAMFVSEKFPGQQ
ncbi:unnamed protein product [Urochloa humidicola]